jgi:SAM-dependent methyltransferase
LAKAGTYTAKDHPEVNMSRQKNEKERQSYRSFCDKWTRNPRLGLKETLDERSNFQRWILGRNGFTDSKHAAYELKQYSRILDAGCGNGRVTALLALLAPTAKIIGVDIIDLEIAKKNTRQFSNIDFVPANLRENLSHLGTFDFIYCEEVLHHTGDAKASFKNLVRILKKNGKIAIYVYRKKAPSREFMDDYIGEQISELDYEKALEICREIARLGKRLSNLNVDIEVEDMPFIGIVAGKYPIQRFIYNFFMKCYWNPSLTEEENAVINYDWYHPQHRSRHTMEEVRAWFKDENLRVTWEFEDLYGITVHGVNE